MKQGGRLERETRRERERDRVRERERGRDARKVEKDMRGGDAPSSYNLSRRHVWPFLPKVVLCPGRPVQPVWNGVMVALVGFFSRSASTKKISFLEKKMDKKFSRL